MTRPAPEDIVNDMLADVDRSARRNMISKNEELAAAITHFLNLKQRDDDRVRGITLAWFYKNKLRDRFNGPNTMDTVRAFVRDILKRDPITGEAL